MPQKAGKSPAGRIEDMLSAIAGIRETTGTDTIGRVADDWTRRHAVERGFEIISEASRHIPAALKEAEPGTAWKKLAGIGNVLRHDYDGVSFVLLFRAIEDEFPQPEAALRRILARL